MPQNNELLILIELNKLITDEEWGEIGAFLTRSCYQQEMIMDPWVSGL